MESGLDICTRKGIIFCIILRVVLKCTAYVLDWILLTLMENVENLYLLISNKYSKNLLKNLWKNYNSYMT